MLHTARRDVDARTPAPKPSCEHPNVAVMVLFVAAFKKGGALSVLYPVYATTFIIAAVIGYLAYDVPIKPINYVGMGVLILGMYLMGR